MTHETQMLLGLFLGIRDEGSAPMQDGGLHDNDRCWRCGAADFKSVPVIICRSGVQSGRTRG